MNEGKLGSRSIASSLAEISWRLPNGPKWADFAVRVSVSAETNDEHSTAASRRQQARDHQ